MTSDDLDAVRTRLAARKDECWARLDDAVSELWALHGAVAEEIVVRVRATIHEERDAGHGRASLRPVPPEA